MLGQDSLFYWKGPQTTLADRAVPPDLPAPARHDLLVRAPRPSTSRWRPPASGRATRSSPAPITDIGTVIGVLFQQARPRLRRPGTRHVQPRPRGRGAADHAPDEGDHRRPPGRQPVRHGRPQGARGPAQADPHRGLRPGLGGAASRQADRHRRAHRLLLAPELQARHLRRRRRRGLGRRDASARLLQRFGDKGFDRLGKGGLFESFATNYRMSEPQAAVAAAQLERARGDRGEAEPARATCSTRRSPASRASSGQRVRPDDRCTYWFYMLRLRPEAPPLRPGRVRQGRSPPRACRPRRDTSPCRSTGTRSSGEHGFFAGRWPVKELGLTSMDYAKVSCPEAEAILEDGRPRDDPRGDERGVRPERGRGRPQGRRPLRRLSAVGSRGGDERPHPNSATSSPPCSHSSQGRPLRGPLPKPCLDRRSGMGTCPSPSSGGLTPRKTWGDAGRLQRSGGWLFCSSPRQVNSGPSPPSVSTGQVPDQDRGVPQARGEEPPVGREGQAAGKTAVPLDLTNTSPVAASQTRIARPRASPCPRRTVGRRGRRRRR